MRIAPGEMYNSAEVQDATDRLRGTPYFDAARRSRRSATTRSPRPARRGHRGAHRERSASARASTPTAALGGNITYEQRNFDITNWPDSFGDIFSDRAFIGAGQNLRITLEPGTEATNASVRFTEPWLFDQPYSFTGEAYYRDRVRED